jgi:hypothetical protein
MGAALLALSVSTVHALPIVSGPAVTLDQDEVISGGRVVVTVDGFSSRNVTIAVCGNEARRGSADCEMTTSQQIRFEDDGEPTWTRFVVPEPTLPCPCVVRVTSPDNDEIAVTPIVITGHPVGPVVDPPTIGDLVDVSISAATNPDGVLDAIRAATGGPALYDVTVSVLNIGPSALRTVRLSVEGSRGDNALPSIEIEDPGLIGVGQTWQQTVRVRVPTPSFGEVEWRATASGAGQPVSATTTTNHRPVLLIVLAVVLVADIGLLLIRFTIRRRVAREAEAGAARVGSTEPVDGQPVDGQPVDGQPVDGEQSDERELIGSAS